MLGQNVKSHCSKSYMQSVKVQYEYFSQLGLLAGVCHTTTAEMMQAEIRN